MSMLDTLKNAFSSGTPTAQPTQPAAPGNPGNLPADSGTAPPATPTTAANGVVPNQTVEAPKAPLDQFSKLWETDPTKTAPSDVPFSFNIDPQKLAEAAGKINFATVIKPETLAAITAGGEGAAPALIEALNATVQASFAQSAIATTKMVESAVAQTRKTMTDSIPDLIKRQSLSNTLREENPAFSHPAAAPVIQALEISLQRQYPNATVTELSDLAKNYFVSLSDAFVPKKETAAEKAAKSDVDWTKFLSA